MKTNKPVLKLTDAEQAYILCTPAALRLLADFYEAKPPSYEMTETAGGYSRDEMLAAGWTDAALLAHGHMVTGNGRAAALRTLADKIEKGGE